MLPQVQMKTTDLAQALQQSQVQEATSGGVGGFLKFDFRTGEWLFGRDGEDVTGDKVIVNTTTIGHGWVLWSNGKATKVMARFNEPLPSPMPNIGDDYPAEGRTMQGAFMDDEGEPTQWTFESNSFGGRKGVDVLLTAIKTKALSGSAFLYPAVVLASESYFNKKQGKEIHNPVFKVISWHNADGNPEESPAKVEDKSEAQAAPSAEPKPRRRRKQPA